MKFHLSEIWWWLGPEMNWREEVISGSISDLKSEGSDVGYERIRGVKDEPKEFVLSS